MMRNRVTSAVLVGLLGINLLIGARAYMQSQAASERREAYRYMRLFAVVLERVHESYVDADKVSYRDLIFNALHGMVSRLDPHSDFLEPDQFENLRSDTEGQFGGIGIQIGIRNERLTVIAPIEDTPAFKAGLMSGDQIIRIEGQETDGMTLEDAVQLLRGKPGTKVTITIFRPSTGETKTVTMTRAIIRINTVRDINGKSEFPVDPDGIGYVRINQFSENTAEELDTALKQLRSNGAKALILDLRDNPGGLLDEAVNVCGRFLEPGSLVVTTEGAHGQVLREYRVPKSSKPVSWPMVILINGGSASASEVVAGCLRDHKRAILVGERTFGKGSVQSVMPLPEGVALRLTTAKYYTPSHRVIHEHGIEPDIVVRLTAQELEAVMVRRVPGGLETLPPDRRRLLETLKDRQLARARDLLRGLLILQQRAGLELAGTPHPAEPKTDRLQPLAQILHQKEKRQTDR